MKKATIFGMVLLVFAVATTAFAGDATPIWKGLEGTTWVGVLTFVHPTDGSTDADNATLTFSTESGKFLWGTIACRAADCVVLPVPETGVDNALHFSGIRNANELMLTAKDYSMFGVLSLGRVHKRGFVPRLVVEGSNATAGDTFIGTLIKQK